MAVAEQFDRPMTMEEIAATVLLDHPEIGNGWLVGCGRDVGFIVGRVVSEAKITYFFSIDPVAMALDELVEIDTGVQRRDIL